MILKNPKKFVRRLQGFLPPPFQSHSNFRGATFDRTLSFSKHVFSLKAKFFPRLKALCCTSASSWGPSKVPLFSVQIFSSAPFHLRFTRMVFFLKCYQSYQIGTPPPIGHSRHHRMLFVLSYPTSSLRGFSTSPTSHPDSLHSFFL